MHYKLVTLVLLVGFLALVSSEDIPKEADFRDEIKEVLPKAGSTPSRLQTAVGVLKTGLAKV